MRIGKFVLLDFVERDNGKLFVFAAVVPWGGVSIGQLRGSAKCWLMFNWGLRFKCFNLV